MCVLPPPVRGHQPFGRSVTFEFFTRFISKTRSASTVDASLLGLDAAAGFRGNVVGLDARDVPAHARCDEEGPTRAALAARVGEFLAAYLGRVYESCLCERELGSCLLA